MAQDFDSILARYRHMNYGGLTKNNPSAIGSLIDEYNDRTYTKVLDPSEVTYVGERPINQWTTDAKGNLVFGMPGQSVQGGLIGDDGTATSAWPIYDKDIDYGDPGYAGVIPEDPITGSPITGGATAEEIYGQGRGGPLGEGKLGTNFIQQYPYQNPAFKGLIGGDYADRNLGDKFTFSDDLPYGQAYDQYGRVRSPEDLKDTWQAMLANSVKQIKKLGPVSVIKSLLDSDDDDKEMDPDVLSHWIDEGMIKDAADISSTLTKDYDEDTSLGKGSGKGSDKDFAGKGSGSMGPAGGAKSGGKPGASAPAGGASKGGNYGGSNKGKSRDHRYS